jgi:signal transduction histidine kinase
LIGVLAVVMGAFVLTSLVSQQTSAKIESLSDQIVSISSPSIESLTSIRSTVFEVQLALSESLHHASGAANRLPLLDAPLKALEEDVQGYLSLPIIPNEEPYWRQMQTALVRFDDAARRTRELAHRGALADAQAEFVHGVEPSGQQLIEAALGAVDFHARKSRSFASEMRDARRQALLIANISSGICVAFGIAGALLIRSQALRHRDLVRAHAEFHEARANEFEQFAGRVAHDIRNPLSAAHMSAHLALRRAPDDAQRETIERILRALSRADAITTGLLDFARSGARPDPGARTDVKELLDDFARGLGPELEHLRIDVRLEPVPPVLVACSSGVYLSLVGNLVRNSLKYMGQSDPRRVTIRVTEVSSSVQTEVVDTGPGIDAKDLPSLFEPYFRAGHDGAKEGLGLGLATVRRLAEGHHGSVDVSSEPGKGSTFSFTLPRAGTTTTSLTAGEHPAEGGLHSPEVH